jgi:hypothetical protein
VSAEPERASRSPRAAGRCGGSRGRARRRLRRSGPAVDDQLDLHQRVRAGRSACPRSWRRRRRARAGTPSSPSRPESPRRCARRTRPGSGVAAPSQTSSAPVDGVSVAKGRPSRITRSGTPSSPPAGWSRRRARSRARRGFWRRSLRPRRSRARRVAAHLEGGQPSRRATASRPASRPAWRRVAALGARHGPGLAAAPRGRISASATRHTSPAPSVMIRSPAPGWRCR